MIVGDIHGQYKDLERMLVLPTAKNIELAQVAKRAGFLFDYVDRGPAAIPFLITLMRLKVKHPSNLIKKLRYFCHEAWCFTVWILNAFRLLFSSCVEPTENVESGDGSDENIQERNLALPTIQNVEFSGLSTGPGNANNHGRDPDEVVNRTKKFCDQITFRGSFQS
ncbi:unnamed protein product [Bursaphelenchus okinawaensis]|uniref:Uncharacterized protein n=1 Tax=Bursaphelenchus okinawaensis TaxID=465554 RepID=A0A811KNT1_9BILA|nr:unnamed protein product [Bursaphelenchus okinawaensis]CAG9107571.1 unnamed protein product [Bursaphelenchus okinawaensis]